MTALNGTNAATARFSSTSSTQAQVNTATTNLVNALANLVRVVTVVKIDAPSSMTLPRNSTYKFSVILNQGAKDDGIVWSINNTAFATVDNNGVVTTKNMAGTVILKVTASNGVSTSIIIRIL